MRAEPSTDQEQGDRSKRRHFERAWGEAGAWQSALILIHPIGVVLYVLITLLCAVIAAHGLPPARQLAPLLGAMFFSQSTVGIVNEFADRKLDTRAKPWRPIPSGRVSPLAAFILAVVTWALSLAGAAALSWPAAALLFCGTATGVLYSAWLKRTPLSWLPYVVAYPGFPLWVWLALGKLPMPDGGSLIAWAHRLLADPVLPRLLAFYPVLTPLALAAHLCNQLRDYEEDLALGMRGFVHYLGQRRALALCFALLMLGPLPMLFYLPVAGQGPALQASAVAAGAPMPGLLSGMGPAAALAAAAILHWIVSLAGIRRYAAWPEANNVRRLFRLLQVTGPLLGLAWLILTLW